MFCDCSGRGKNNLSWHQALSDEKLHLKIIFLPKKEIIPNIWQGDLCNVSKCDLQCVHGGTCEWENNYQGKYCNCPAGYAGDFCQHDTSQDVSKYFILVRGAKWNIFQMCKVIGCDNGCECQRLDSSLINRHCEYNCDFECSNKNNTFHLGKRCQFAQPTLNCNSGLIANINIIYEFWLFRFNRYRSAKGRGRRQMASFKSFSL